MAAEIPEVLIISTLTFAFLQLLCISVFILTVSQDVCIGKLACKIRIIGKKSEEQGLCLHLIC